MEIEYTDGTVVNVHVPTECEMNQEWNEMQAKLAGFGFKFEIPAYNVEPTCKNSLREALK